MIIYGSNYGSHTPEAYKGIQTQYSYLCTSELSFCGVSKLEYITYDPRLAKKQGSHAESRMIQNLFFY